MRDSETEAPREMVLVGAGHAHVEVLRSFAMERPPATRVTLVSPHSFATYSGMVPGYLAGQYTLREAQIDARALAARAGARFIATTVTGIEPRSQTLQLAHHPDLVYDFVSFDIGSRPALADRIQDGSRTVEVKPIEVAASGIEAALQRAAPDGRRVVVVGAGPGGVEIAFAVAARLRQEEASSVTVCDRAGEPASERGPATSKRVRRAFETAGIAFLGGTEVDVVDGDGVRTAGGTLLPADLVIWATGAGAPPLSAASGLALDDRGFLLVDDHLRSTSDPRVFGAGDCVSLKNHPDLAKAGVYAVRQGPLLTANLRAALGQRRLRTFRPQTGFLSLLNTGDGKAILSWRSLGLRSRLAWWLKDRIDRRFIERYARPELGPPDSSMGEMRACGGCAAKVGADVLSRVLERLAIPTAPHVRLGVREADDAAVFDCADPEQPLAVATADLFPPFSEDFHLAGRIAAVNAASDLYATGAEGRAAIAIVSVGSSAPRDQEATLEALLHGALAALGEMEIPLVGGHSIADQRTLIGFSMYGRSSVDRILSKAGAQPGDCLVLGKPLGTGVILAAAGMGCADSDWVEAAHRSMLRPNRRAMQLLHAHGATACTDVTGFGLLGHVGELAERSAVALDLVVDSVPALPGARELLQHGWRSSFHASNARATAQADADPLLLDPQTSGGLLASVPADRIDGLLAAARQDDEPLWVIGKVITNGIGSIRVR